MIRKVRVENYKSIANLTLDLGRLTVLIGANGSGKSNILEAIALASAASQNKLDNEFLVSRGIRVTETRFMRSAFGKPSMPRQVMEVSFRRDREPTIEKVHTSSELIKISIEGDDKVAFDCEVLADEGASYPKWEQLPWIRKRADVFSLLTGDLAPETEITPEIISRVLNQIAERLRDRPAGTLPGFLVYAPRTPPSAHFRPKDRSSHSESRAKGCSLTSRH